MMTRLTIAQSKPLLDIVDYQRKMGKELTYTHYEEKIRASKTVSGESIPATQTPIAEVSSMVFPVWQERGYVEYIESPNVSGTTIRDFVLTQDALDYSERMHKPKLVRVFLDILDNWKSDLRTAILAMVFTIITTVVLNLLGLLR